MPPFRPPFPSRWVFKCQTYSCWVSFFCFESLSLDYICEIFKFSRSFWAKPPPPPPPPPPPHTHTHTHIAPRHCTNLVPIPTTCYLRTYFGISFVCHAVQSNHSRLNWFVDSVIIILCHTTALNHRLIGLLSSQR